MSINEKNMDLFGGRSEVERMKNVANMVHDIVNPKSTEPEEVPAEVQAETTDTEGNKERKSKKKKSANCKKFSNPC